MKSILVAIFVVGTGVPLMWHLAKPAPTLKCASNRQCWVFIPVEAEWNLSESETRRLKILEYPTCPWWTDPELWWNQSCDGGLPPRLPVPEGL